MRRSSGYPRLVCSCRKLKGCGPPLFASFELASIDSGAAVLVIPAVSFTLAQFGETLERATHDALVSPLVDLDAFRASVYESASAIARHVRTAAVECGVVLLPLRKPLLLQPDDWH